MKLLRHDADGATRTGYSTGDVHPVDVHDAFALFPTPPVATFATAR